MKEVDFLEEAKKSATEAIVGRLVMLALELDGGEFRVKNARGKVRLEFKVWYDFFHHVVRDDLHEAAVALYQKLKEEQGLT